MLPHSRRFWVVVCGAIAALGWAGQNAAAQGFAYGNLNASMRRGDDPRAGSAQQAAYWTPASKSDAAPAPKSFEELPRPGTTAPSPVPEGTIIEPMPMDGTHLDGGIVGEGFGVNLDGVPGCGETPWMWWDGLSYFVGIDSFKGPLDQGQNGNHGIHEGVNYVVPLSFYYQIAAQVGVRATQSNFSGTNLSSDQRNQLFFTGGLFRRVPCGWQYGAVVDYLDDRYYTNFTLYQARGELSFVCASGSEFGVFATGSSNSDVATFTPRTGAAQSLLFEPTEQLQLFYRRKLSSCGEMRISGGGTTDNDGLLGGELWAPIGDRCAVSVIANYKITGDSKGTATNGAVNVGHVDEAWSLGVSLVFYPCRSPKTEACSPYRPLFNVADNAAFMVERLVQ